jgi:hypothetical protein
VLCLAEVFSPAHRNAPRIAFEQKIIKAVDGPTFSYLLVSVGVFSSENIGMSSLKDTRTTYYSSDCWWKKGNGV